MTKFPLFIIQPNSIEFIFLNNGQSTLLNKNDRSILQIDVCLTVWLLISVHCVWRALLLNVSSDSIKNDLYGESKEKGDISKHWHIHLDVDLSVCILSIGVMVIFYSSSLQITNNTDTMLNYIPSSCRNKISKRLTKLWFFLHLL